LRLQQTRKDTPWHLTPSSQKKIKPGSPLNKKQQLTKQLTKLDAQQLTLIKQQHTSTKNTEKSLHQQTNITPNTPTTTNYAVGKSLKRNLNCFPFSLKAKFTCDICYTA
jgi:hypothetical protein